MNTPISIIANALVRERQRAGLSLAEVARRAGIAKSTLSQLEAGNGNPGIETLWSLCVTLNIPFSRLLEPDARRLQVIRRGEGLTVTANLADYQAVCWPPARPAFGVISICWKFSPAANAFPSPISPIPLSILLSLKGVRWWARSTVRWSWMWGLHYLSGR